MPFQQEKTSCVVIVVHEGVAHATYLTVMAALAMDEDVRVVIVEPDASFRMNALVAWMANPEEYNEDSEAGRARVLVRRYLHWATPGGGITTPEAETCAIVSEGQTPHMRARVLLLRCCVQKTLAEAMDAGLHISRWIASPDVYMIVRAGTMPGAGSSRAAAACLRKARMGICGLGVVDAENDLSDMIAGGGVISALAGRIIWNKETSTARKHSDTHSRIDAPSAQALAFRPDFYFSGERISGELLAPYLQTDLALRRKDDFTLGWASEARAYFFPSLTGVYLCESQLDGDKHPYRPTIETLDKAFARSYMQFVRKWRRSSVPMVVLMQLLRATGLLVTGQGNRAAALMQGTLRAK